jgi:tetratricopeptide (TPR) repeat protein
VAFVPTNRSVQQSIFQYIRSFLEALPRLYALVMDLYAWDRQRFEPRKEFVARTGQVNEQLFTAAITFIQLVTAGRMMRRVMLHHCKTYSIAPKTCPTAELSDAIAQSNGASTFRHMLDVAAAQHPYDYRPAYARALLLEEEGDLRGAADEYRGIVSLPRPGGYSLLRAGSYAEEQGAIAAYRKAIELYPIFARAQRALADAVRHTDPLTAAQHYSDALSHSPRLEYGEQSWVMGRRVTEEVEVYHGFRIYFAPEERLHIAFPIFLGVSTGTVEGRTQTFWRRFLGLVLLRLHKDKIWRRIRLRFRRPVQALQWEASGGAIRASTAALDMMRAAGRKAIGWLVQLLWYSVDALPRWVVQHFHYFQFSLVGPDLQDVKKQIDLIYAKWMRDGPLR